MEDANVKKVKLTKNHLDVEDNWGPHRQTLGISESKAFNNFNMEEYLQLEGEIEAYIFFMMNKFPHLPDELPELEEIKPQLVSYYEKIVKKFKDEKDEKGNSIKFKKNYLEYFEEKKYKKSPKDSGVSPQNNKDLEGIDKVSSKDVSQTNKNVAKESINSKVKKSNVTDAESNDSKNTLHPGHKSIQKNTAATIDMFVNTTCIAKILHMFYFLFNYHGYLSEHSPKLTRCLFRTIIHFMRSVNQKDAIYAFRDVCLDGKMLNFYIDLFMIYSEELDNSLIEGLQKFQNSIESTIDK